MRLRITKVDEYQFLTCLKYSLWGSKSARFKDWQEGDYLSFIVNKELAGFAIVSGKSFQSTDAVWDNGLFPHRIPIKFVHLLNRDQRVPILGEVRDINISMGTKLWLGHINTKHNSRQASRNTNQNYISPSKRAQPN